MRYKKFIRSPLENSALKGRDESGSVFRPQELRALARGGSIFLFCLASVFVFSKHIFAEKMDKIVAIVNEDVITDEELNVFLKITSMDEEPEVKDKDLQELKKALLDRMIEDRLILQEAKRLQLKPDEKIIEDRIRDIKQKAGNERAFEQALKAEGVSLNELREKLKNQILVYLVIEREIKNKVTVSPKEVTDFFNLHQSEFVVPEAAVVDSIFVDTKEDLEKVEQELGEGKDFNVVAGKYSKKSNIGEARRGQLKKELEDFIFGLNIGQCSMPFSVDDGFYIFLVKEQRLPSNRELDEVKDKITARLEQEKMEKLLKEWVESLKEKAYISVRE